MRLREVCMFVRAETRQQGRGQLNKNGIPNIQFFDRVGKATRIPPQNNIQQGQGLRAQACLLLNIRSRLAVSKIPTRAFTIPTKPAASPGCKTFNCKEAKPNHQGSTKAHALNGTGKSLPHHHPFLGPILILRSPNFRLITIIRVLYTQNLKPRVTTSIRYPSDTQPAKAAVTQTGYAINVALETLERLHGV